MSTFSDALIDAMGGTTKVSELTDAPPSTVQSWRKKLTRSRLNHLRRVIETEQLDIDVSALALRFDVVIEGVAAGHSEGASALAAGFAPGKSDAVSPREPAHG